MCWRLPLANLLIRADINSKGKIAHREKEEERNESMQR